MNVRCDNCENTFNLDGLTEETLAGYTDKRYGGSIDKVYFECPHCGEEFVSYYIDDNIRRKQAEVRRLNSENMADEAQELKEEIGQDLDELRERIERDN